MAGGQSRRFGFDKARVILDNQQKPMIIQIQELIHILGLKSLVIADQNDKYRDLGISAIQDIIPQKGPLGGLYTALYTAKTDKILVLTCDMPCLSIFFLKKMLLLGQSKGTNLVLKTHQGYQPFPGIYSMNSLTLAWTMINSEQLIMRHFIGQLQNLRTLNVSRQTKDLFNMNTIHDYQTLISTSSFLKLRERQF